MESPRLNNRFAWSYLQAHVSNNVFKTFKDLLFIDPTLIEGSSNFIRAVYGPPSLSPTYDSSTDSWSVGYNSKFFSFSETPVTSITSLDTEKDAFTCLKWDIARFIIPYLAEVIPCWYYLNHLQKIALISFSHSEGKFFGELKYATITKELNLFKEKNDNGKAVAESLLIYYGNEHDNNLEKSRRYAEHDLFFKSA